MKQPPTISSRKEPPTVSGRANAKEPPRAIRREFYKNEDFEQSLNEAMMSGQAIDIALTDIHQSPYQTRSLRPSHLAELIANIVANGLITPVLLRKRDAGGFELIAGHHRVAAFLSLERPTIAAIIVKMDDDMASKAVFYDNLHGPDLTDYEKYLGLIRRLKDKKFSQRQLSEEAGVSPSQISRLLSYDPLPDACHRLMIEHPGAIGANTAESLREHVASGRLEWAVKVVQKIIDGELNQTSASAWIDTQVKGPKDVAIKPQVLAIYRHGSAKQLFCKMQVVRNTLRVDFKSDGDVDEVQMVVENAIRNYLESKKQP